MLKLQVYKNIINYMSVEEKIKKWVVLDNQIKQLLSQIQLLKDEKNDLTNNLIEHFDIANKKYPIINISGGKLSFIIVKQPNALSYKFLEQCSEPLLIDHALVLHKNTPVTIVDKFFEKSIKYCPGSKINSKNMIFLWKKFLEEKELPNIVFYENLKTLFKKKWAFSEEEDSFLDATSIYLPLVATFNKFWETTIVSEDDEDSGYDLEVDELSSLFKKWTRWTSIVISDSMLIELIKHFYPDVTLVDDKYILNIKCNLWDKRKEIIDSLELYKNKIKTNESSENVTKSLYEAYEFYSADNREKSKHVASKQYFEKVASEIINTHIDGDGLISPTWWK